MGQIHAVQLGPTEAGGLSSERAGSGRPWPGTGEVESAAADFLAMAASFQKGRDFNNLLTGRADNRWRASIKAAGSPPSTPRGAAGREADEDSPAERRERSYRFRANVANAIADSGEQLVNIALISRSSAHSGPCTDHRC